MKKLISLAAATVMAVVVAVPSLSLAAEYGGVGGRPAYPRGDNPRSQSIFIYELKHGQQASDGVKVYNNTSSQQTIRLNAVDSVLATGGAFSCAQNTDPKKDVGSWIKLHSGSVTLPANSSKIIPFTVTVPAGADVGEHDGCVAIQAQPASNKQTGKNGVVLSFRSAIRVVVTIPGKIIKKLALESVSVDKAKTGGTYVVAPIVRNEGNVSLDTKVQVKLTTVFGTEIGKSVGGTYPVLPRSKASWNFETKPPFWGGWYRADASASYNSNPTALLGKTKGDSKTIRLASGLFFVPPAPGATVLYALLLVALAVVTIIFVRKQRDIRHIREHWQGYTAKAGDTVTELAKQHRISWRKLARANKLKAPYALHEGQKLALPPMQEDIKPQKPSSKPATKSRK